MKWYEAWNLLQNIWVGKGMDKTRLSILKLGYGNG